MSLSRSNLNNTLYNNLTPVFKQAAYQAMLATCVHKGSKHSISESEAFAEAFTKTLCKPMCNIIASAIHDYITKANVEGTILVKHAHSYGHPELISLIKSSAGNGKTGTPNNLSIR